MGHRPIVVVNKIDKPTAEPERVVDEVFDLFANMDATEEQLNSQLFMQQLEMDMLDLQMMEIWNLKPLFETILKEVSKPKVKMKMDYNYKYLHDYDNFIGKIGITRFSTEQFLWVKL